MTVDAIVQEGLPENLLSTTQLVENLGVLIFDAKGAAVLPTKHIPKLALYRSILKREIKFYTSSERNREQFS